MILIEKIIRLIDFLGITRFFKLRMYLLRMSGITIENNTKICGDVRFYGHGKVKIGASTWVGIGCKFYCPSEGGIYIGANCDLGPEITVLAGSHKISGTERRAGKGTHFKTTVKDGCWIGANVTILPGVTINESSIIAAGSTVISDVKANTVVGGNPANMIKSLDS